MNTEEKNKEIDINEVAITLEVDSEVIAKVRSGEITHVLMDINEDNQNLNLTGQRDTLGRCYLRI